jgi:hypothetical protein
MKSDNPPINHGTDSPPAKKDFKLIPVLAKTRPMHNTNAEKTKMTMVSMLGLIIKFTSVSIDSYNLKMEINSFPFRN